VLFFIDETWQEIGGQQIAALGGVAIRLKSYNPFCREVFAIKKNILGAVELRDAELKGKKCFANRSFRTRTDGERSKLLDTADELFDCLDKYGAKTFVIWTTAPSLISLRSAQTTELSRAYKGLLYDFRELMRGAATNRLGSLNFDQRDIGSDEAATCALQNYLVRTRGNWDRTFVTVPSFTVSAVSPGLQAADLVAYLGAHYARPQFRPELKPFLDRVTGLQYEWESGRGTRRSIREVREVRARQGAGGLSP
jgi:hypothetical protein